jgi:hypothetical protein
MGSMQCGYSYSSKWAVCSVAIATAANGQYAVWQQLFRRPPQTILARHARAKAPRLKRELQAQYGRPCRADHQPRGRRPPRALEEIRLRADKGHRRGRGAAGRRHRRQEAPGWRWHAASGQLAACLHFVFDRERGLRPGQLELVGGAG